MSTASCWQSGCDDPAVVADWSVWTSPTTRRVTVHGFCEDHSWHKLSPSDPDLHYWRNERAGTVRIGFQVPFQ
jgi:hypothetical protein